MTDREYMHLAMELAKQGTGKTAPNPLVGAVLVKDGQIIGQGFHAKYGDLHAERNALKNCVISPKGATLYVTLEPCCHHGRQPPCTDAILESGIQRVVIGSDDPNPLVAGKGIRILREHGIQVATGVLKDECDALNPVFFHFIQTGRPYVVMKYAMTMDGKIAARTGESRWITGEIARKRVHEDRNRYRAILVGSGTVLADDPALRCQIEGGRDPIRVICDTRLRTPLGSQIVRTAQGTPTILATSCNDPAKTGVYQAAGCHVWTLPERDHHVDLHVLMEQLGQHKIDSVLLEGGGTLNWAALQCGIVQKVQAYIAPKLFGGAEAKSPIEGLGIAHPVQAYHLKNTTVTRLGEDFLLESEVETDVYRNR